MKIKKLATVSLCSTLLLTLVACSQTQKTSDSTAETSVTQSQSNQVSWKATYSNLNNQPSAEEVRKALAAHLDKDSVDAFFNLVNDYNATVGSVGLTGDFSTFTKTDYDVEKISNLWTPKKGDFVGTNCRINSYCLLKNSIEIPKLEKMIPSCLSITMPLTKEKSLVQKTRMLLIFYSQESRPKQRQMSKFMLQRWNNFFLNSSLMKMQECSP